MHARALTMLLLAVLPACTSGDTGGRQPREGATQPSRQQAAEPESEPDRTAQHDAGAPRSASQQPGPHDPAPPATSAATPAASNDGAPESTDAASAAPPPAGRTSPNAFAWTRGTPAPDVAGFRLLGENDAGLPEYAKDLPGGVTMRFVLIPAGSFTMGSPPDEPGRFPSEGPQVEVRLAAFLLAATECTQEQWQAVMHGNPSAFPQAGPQAPVEWVSFHDAAAFCSRAGVQLPSEAQWEYAARAGTTGASHAGDLTVLGHAHVPELDAIAWYPGNSGVEYDGESSENWPEMQVPHERAGTHPVGLKAPNAFGLYDMLGNVWEWCQDVYSPDHVGQPADGTPREQGTTQRRVHRGGGWDLDGWTSRSALRAGSTATYRSNSLGFRPAYSLHDRDALDAPRRSGG